MKKDKILENRKAILDLLKQDPDIKHTALVDVFQVLVDGNFSETEDPQEKGEEFLAKMSGIHQALHTVNMHLYNMKKQLEAQCTEEELMSGNLPPEIMQGITKAFRAQLFILALSDHLVTEQHEHEFLSEPGMNIEYRKGDVITISMLSLAEAFTRAIILNEDGIHQEQENTVLDDLLTGISLTRTGNA